MTSNAASDEIQQVMKTQNMSKRKNSIVDIEDQNEKKSTPLLTERIYQDEYAGAIQFLESPIKESFLVDMKGQMSVEFERSFRALNNYSFLENELKKINLSSNNEISEKEVENTLKSIVLEKLSGLFLPEFLNRLDDIIVFQPLKQEELRKICDIMIKQVSDRVKPKQITLIVDENVRNKLSREGYNPAFGARPLRRLITKYIEDLISENILRSVIPKKGREIRITLNDNDQIVAMTPAIF
jgi:ATP-dependent Clp protease ATP-binding subunit ClpC